MACNENIIKNMANEVTRNCQVSNINVEPEFVMYLIELLLLNPKYGKLFSKTLSRISLEHFVNECVAMIIRGGTPLSTLKMQFIMIINYDKPSNMIHKHQDNVAACLKPLITEILDADPDPDDEVELRKLYRKISIYIILASGLGNPAIIMNLKEGMAALESVFSMEELSDMVVYSRSERMARLEELLALTSGVRLFNRDCKKGGDMIPDLPFDLIDAGKGCLTTLSNCLVAAMQRVNALTTAIEDRLTIHEETYDVHVDVPAGTELTVENYQHVFELLIFNRQYEIYIRRLLTDVEGMVDTSKYFTGYTFWRECSQLLLQHDLISPSPFALRTPRKPARSQPYILWKFQRQYEAICFLVVNSDRKEVDQLAGFSVPKSYNLDVFKYRVNGFLWVARFTLGHIVTYHQELSENCKTALEEIHSAVKYKSAVPIVTVFPLFTKLWDIWHSMQNTMYLVSTVTRLMVILNNIQDHNRLPYAILDRMLAGKTVISDEQRVSGMMTLEERISALSMSSAHRLSTEQISQDAYSSTFKERHVAFLGFCTMSLNVGALVPSNVRIGCIKYKGNRYAFANIKAAARFNRDPERYINEVLDYARNHPQIINLLNMQEAVRSVKDVENLVTKFVPKTKVEDKDIQTDVHPVEEYKEHNYSWDLWEWKRRACQWATIVNCKTHSTQTNYSHLRSEIHCQTTEPRDKGLQTKKTTAMNTNTCNYYLWGLRGLRDGDADDQVTLDMVPKHSLEKAKVDAVYRCSWPCVGVTSSQTSAGSDFYDSDSNGDKEFYRPD